MSKGYLHKRLDRLGQDEVRVVTNGTTTIDVTQQKVFIDASKGNIQSIEVKDTYATDTTVIATGTPPTQIATSRFRGTLVQGSVTYQVALEKTKTYAA